MPDQMPSRPAANAEVSRLVHSHRDADGRIPTLAITDLERELKHHLDATVEQAITWGIQEGKRQVAAGRDGIKPRRVDPTRCGCNDCLTDYSVPVDRANWQTIKAMLDGQIENATGTEMDVHEDRNRVVVTLADERGWDDGQRWEWNRDVPVPQPTSPQDQARESVRGMWNAAFGHDP
jgi:hypothetical protein